MSKKYIHYGSPEFCPEVFTPIRNCRAFTKPDGGLWASPINAKYSWKQWCKENGFRECRTENSFEFELTPDAKVLYICSDSVLEDLPQIEDEFALSDWYLLDFEKLLEQGYDAVEINITADPQLYWSLYGWDCDSILIMNPEVIVNV